MGAVLEFLDFADEFTDVFELAVDRYVAHVGDWVDVVEFVHDFDADDVGGAFGEVVLVKLCEDFFDCAVESLHRDGAFFAGFDEAAEEFFAVEGLAGTVAFDDSQLGALNLLVGGVTVLALQALASAPSSGAVFRHTRVDDFVFEGTTLNTAHKRK